MSDKYTKDYRKARYLFDYVFGPCQFCGVPHVSLWRYETTSSPVIEFNAFICLDCGEKNETSIAVTGTGPIDRKTTKGAER